MIRRLRTARISTRATIRPSLKGHRDAVALFEAYAKGGDDAELKGWAGQTLPHLKEHLSMAEKLK